MPQGMRPSTFWGLYSSAGGVTDRLDIVPVGIEHEGAVVVLQRTRREERPSGPATNPEIRLAALPNPHRRQTPLSVTPPGISMMIEQPGGASAFA